MTRRGGEQSERVERLSLSSLYTDHDSQRCTIYSIQLPNTYAEIPGHMIVLLESIQNNRFVWENRCYVIIGLMEQLIIILT